MFLHSLTSSETLDNLHLIKTQKDIKNNIDKMSL